VFGIDVARTAEATIGYRRYDGLVFPVEDNSFDAVLLCYVLHHAQDVSVLLSEIRRVLRAGGLAIVYEDIPRTCWDKGICWIHNRQWRGRSGVCTFRTEAQWDSLFVNVGFEILSQRRLSRWRNFAHPVRRMIFISKRDWSR